MRQFSVGADVRPDAIDVKFENAVLSLELKKLRKVSRKGEI